MIKRFFSSQLISGSLVMTLGTAVAGVFNYLYHLFMGRMLGPVDYGILASLISLAYLLSVPTATLNLVIVKFVSAL
jgi:O-antigen/teichoic acid export membrane protein